MDATALLEQDLILLGSQRHTRSEAEVIARRIVEGITTVAQEAGETLISQHNNGYMHTTGDDY